jgi:uncharacterized membrane protein
MNQQVNQQLRRMTLSGWGGVTFLLLGALFLWLTISPHAAENWWAVFILIPGLMFMGLAWVATERSNGRFPFLTRFLTGISAILLTVTGIFLFNLSWNSWWPLMIVVPGASLWYACLGMNRRENHAVETAVSGLGRSVGFTTALLGGTFLADQLDIISLYGIFGNFRWWGLFVMIPAVGALIEVLKLRRKGSYLVAETCLWLTVVFVGGTAVQELTGANWAQMDGLIGVWLVATGIILLLTSRRRLNTDPS